MSKRRKVGILLIIIGTFIPSVLYPFTTLTRDATLMKVILVTKGRLYKSGLSDLEIVLRKSRNPYLNVGNQHDKVAIPYNYTVALGITIAFVGGQ
jgi:hypothetical protein